MAGSLKPSTAGKEAKYAYVGGATSRGSYNKDGSGLFNEKITQLNTQGNAYLYEGSFYNSMNTGSSALNYVILNIKEKCNIYAHIALGSNPETQSYNYSSSCTGKLRILQYDGSAYTIDVTDKYWIGRKFNYNSATALSNGLTFEQFLSTELIDRYWQKMISNLPPGQYQFIQYDSSNNRQDNEWFLEKIETPSVMLKTKIIETMNNNESFQRCVKYEINNEEV